MRWEFGVAFESKDVTVAQGVLIIKGSEIVDIIRSRMHSPTFVLSMIIKEWNGFEESGTRGTFKATGFEPSAYSVTDRGDLQLMVPELADLVAVHRNKKNFALEVWVADEGWMTPPRELSR